MIKNKDLILDQWENEVFLGAIYLAPDLDSIRSDMDFQQSLESLNNTFIYNTQSTEEEWMFI